MNLSIEKRLNANYKIVSIIKSNEKAKITRLRNEALSRDIIMREFTGSGESYKKLLSVRQKNLPETYDVFNEQDKCIVLEEFIDGTTVADILFSDLYTERGAAIVGSEVCNALFTLHSTNIIHRDIKPENIMVTSSGRVVLIDLGAARIFKNSGGSDTFIVGTAGYAAPEQFGFSESDPRTDIFSLGVTLNVMLTGRHPSEQLYGGKLGKVIARCIKFSPDRRFSSAAELKQTLQKFI